MIVSSTLPELLQDDSAARFVAAGVPAIAGLRSGVLCAAAVATPPGDGTSTVWVMNHDGSGVTQLTQGTAGGGATEAQFSPDGPRIVFERRPAGPRRARCGGRTRHLGR